MVSRANSVLALLLLVLFSVFLTGCFSGRSRIYASDGGSYDVYADGEFLCNTGKECSVQTRGSSSPKLLKAVSGGEVVGMHHIERSITLSSVLWAPFTYYSSLFIYKAYPDNIEIAVYPGEVRSKPTSAWKDQGVDSDDRSRSSGSGGSVWDQPLLSR